MNFNVSFYKSSDNKTGWQRQHQASFGVAQGQIDNVLTELAAELNLTASIASADKLDAIRRR